METTRIFSLPFEKAFRGILVAFLLLIVPVSCNMLPDWATDLKPWKFFAAIVCLNAVHTIFTGILLFTLPEFKSWFLARVQSGRVIALVVMGAVITFCAIITLEKTSEGVGLFAAYVMLILSSVHSVSQVKGLSLMYNNLHAKVLTPEELPRHRAVEGIERKLFFLLIVMVFVRQGFDSIGHTAHYKLPIVLVAGTTALLLLFNGTRYPKIEGSNKRLYLTSVLFVALGTYWQIILYLQKALHGIEYAFLCYDIQSRSTRRKTAAWKIFSLVAIAAFIPMAMLRAKFIPHGQSYAVIWKSILAFQFFVEYSHYYLDSLLFKFSDPLVRTHLKSAIVPAMQPTAEALPMQTAA